MSDLELQDLKQTQVYCVGMLRNDFVAFGAENKNRFYDVIIDSMLSESMSISRYRIYIHSSSICDTRSDDTVREHGWRR